ncbi:MAG: hypothetical protein K1X88_04895 [Nannocystaceae bacterium]|nr:hypothetical protein [Nannocystaceae bacterium]
MASSIVFASLLALLAAAPPPAAASRPSAEIELAIGGRKVLARGTVAARKDVAVSIAGRRTVKTGVLAAGLFREHASFATELSKGKAALQGAPIVTDEVVELATSTLLTRTTAFVVVDPKALRKSSPMFARLRDGKAIGTRLADLSAEQRAGFDAFKRELGSKPADHPLRKAMAKGDQALLDAMGDGVGDVALTTTVVVPKGAPALDKSGHVVAPKQLADGSFADPPTSLVRPPISTALVTAKPPAPETSESGTCKHTTKFLAGFTESDQWDYRVRFDIPGAFFRFKASAWYGYGLRIPIEVTASQSPRTITTGGDHDVDSEYDVTVSATTKDASKSFYEDVGLAPLDVWDGDELVLETGFSITLHAEVLGGVILDKVLPKNSALSYSQDFVPPMAGCGTACGFDVWIPASITKTSIDLGVAKGSARAGVKVAGEGEIAIDFEAMAQHGDASSSIDSWTAGDKKNAKKKHTLSFEKASDQKKRIAGLSPLTKSGASKSFGHRLSNPRYTWDVALIPGVRGDVEITVWPFKQAFVIGPYWLDSVSLELGSVDFGPHAGTTTKVETLHGNKSWHKHTPDASGQAGVDPNVTIAK